MRQLHFPRQGSKLLSSPARKSLPHLRPNGYRPLLSLTSPPPFLRHEKEFCKTMAPGGRVSKQTTLTGKTIQDTQSLDESNNLTPTVNKGDSTRIKKGRGKTRGKGLEKMKKALGCKMKIEIPIGKRRPTKPVQSAKLSNELGIIARNFFCFQTSGKNSQERTKMQH